MVEVVSTKGLILHLEPTRLKAYIFSLAQDGIALGCLGVRIEPHHDSQVLEWVLLELSALHLLAAI